MKYSGTIVGFQSSFGSIYHIIIEDTKCYAWKANVIADLNDKMLTITFTLDGNFYQLVLTLLKQNYYTGKIIWNQEQGGKVIFYKYSNEKGIFLKGDFEEEDAGNFEWLY